MSQAATITNTSAVIEIRTIVWTLSDEFRLRAPAKFDWEARGEISPASILLPQAEQNLDSGLREAPQ